MMLFGFSNKFRNINLETRNEWVKDVLLNLSPNLKILDVGAGECQYKKYCSHLEYVSQDICEYDGLGNSKGLQTKEWNTSSIDIVSDITDMPIPSASFDVVLCTEVLEHVPNPVKAVNEMDRVLRPGGYMILTAPFCSLTHFAPYHYVSGYNRYFYENLLSSNYEIVRMESNGNWFEYIIQELHRTPFVVSKYTSQSINIFEKINIFIMMNILRSYSKKQKKSEELLCFGYMCVLKKK